jgi:hypothetical protein
LLGAWHAAFGAEPMTVGQVLEAVQENLMGFGTADARDPRREALSQLQEVLQDMEGRQKGGHAHAIGIYLNQQKGRIVDGLELVSGGKHAGSSRWVVRRVRAEGVSAQLSLPLATSKEVR